MLVRGSTRSIKSGCRVGNMQTQNSVEYSIFVEGTEVEFTASEAGWYMLSAAEGENNADIGVAGEYGYDWITLPYEFKLEADETIKFIVTTTAYMTLTEDEINLVLAKVTEEVPDDSSSEGSSLEDSPSPEDGSSEEDSGSDKQVGDFLLGCFSSISGLSMGVVALGAAVLLKKKKED